MSSIEEYMEEEFDIATLISNITENHTDATLWYDLFQETESGYVKVADLNLPEFNDLSNGYHANNASVFALNQAIHFCVDDNLRQHYITAKCLHLSMLHGELNYDYNKSSPHLAFLNQVLEQIPLHLAAVEAKVSILCSNPQQEEYNQYKEWVLANINNLVMQELPEKLQTERIRGDEDDGTIDALKEIIGYYDAAIVPEEIQLPLIGSAE